MAACGGCGSEIEASFRFCPWCAAPQRRKLVEFFRPHPRDAGRALRVSRYFGDEPQVRFSVWDDGIAQAAVSLEDAEARRDRALGALSGVEARCEGTFFVWFRLPDELTCDDLLTKHRVAVAPGEGFGDRGRGWARLSLATPEDRLDLGLERLAAALA